MDVIVLQRCSNWRERFARGRESVPHDFAENGVVFADVVPSAINKAPPRRRVSPHRAQRRSYRKCGIAVESAEGAGLIALGSEGDNEDEHPEKSPRRAFHNLLLSEGNVRDCTATPGHERLAGKLASDRDPRAILKRQ